MDQVYLSVGSTLGFISVPFTVTLLRSSVYLFIAAQQKSMLLGMSFYTSVSWATALHTYSPSTLGREEAEARGQGHPRHQARATSSSLNRKKINECRLLIASYLVYKILRNRMHINSVIRSLAKLHSSTGLSAQTVALVRKTALNSFPPN